MNLRCEFFLQTAVGSLFVTDCLYERDLALYLRVSRSDEGVLTESPLQAIQKSVEEFNPKDSASLAQIVSEVLQTYEFKSEFAFSASLLVDEQAHIVTKGSGGIHLVKDGVVTRIISSNQNATGQIAVGDILLLGPQDLLIDQDTLQSLPLPLDRIEDDLTAKYRDNDIGGFIILERLSEQVAVSNLSPIATQEPMSAPMAAPTLTPEPDSAGTTELSESRYDKLKILFVKKNLVVTILSLIIVVALIWSVVFGYKRRVKSEILQSTVLVSTQVEEKLLDASETALFDVSEAKTLLSDARTIFQPLMQKAKDNNLDNLEEITKISSSIETMSKKIGDLENKKPDEFYDIGLLGDDVNIDGFAQSEDGWVGLVDSKAGKTYAMAIEKKSVTTYSTASLKKAKKVIYDKQKIYFLTNDGVYLKTEEGKEKKVITSEGWGNIVDMVTYNGNIYLLDRKNNDIHKYLVASDDLFSAKTTYFKSGQTVELQSSVGFAVDGSFYVALGDNKVEKYTSGIGQSFDIKTDKQFEVTQILTNELTDNVFVFDKPNSKILIFGKDGEYKREILSGYLSQASDIALISNNRLIFLVGKKVYLLK